MKTFPCPRCRSQVAAVADYIARGLVCPNCGQGFAPVRVEAKLGRRESREPSWLAWGVAALGLLFLIVGTDWLESIIF